MKRFSEAAEQLRDKEKVVSWIAEITGQPKKMVQSRLLEEFNNPGINVKRAFLEAGLEPYIWSEELARFYSLTDAFLYELVIWNFNKIKKRMRRWIANFLTDCKGRKFDILSIGDGLGFDSAYLAGAGHRVTYFEVPGYAESFARKVFNECKQNLTVVTDQANIPLGGFDVVLCLDVLEHVPNPAKLVEKIASYLRPGGYLIVHAPFYMIHPANPTHLKANRRYSGSLSLYKKFNLRLIDGEPGWNPIVLQKITGSSPSCRSNMKILYLRLAGWYFAAGRLSTLPFFWINSYRRKRNRWFDR